MRQHKLDTSRRRFLVSLGIALAQLPMLGYTQQIENALESTIIIGTPEELYSSINALFDDNVSHTIRPFTANGTQIPTYMVGAKEYSAEHERQVYTSMFLLAAKAKARGATQVVWRLRPQIGYRFDNEGNVESMEIRMRVAFL